MPRYSWPGHAQGGDAPAAGVREAVRALRSRLHALGTAGLVAALERLRSEMIQTESNEALLANLRGPG